MESNKNGRKKIEGNKKRRLGNLQDGLLPDEAVTVAQMTRYLNGELVTSAGLFGTLNANQAIKIPVPGGFIYLPTLQFP